MDEKKNIFIVDDIEENLQVIGTILKENNLNISFARNGTQAIAGIEKKLPDLILLDITMPDIDGFEVCGKLKANPATEDIPIIFLTARTQTEEIVRGFRTGAVDYVTKPFNKEELLARVSTHLQLKEARDIISRQNEELKIKNEELYRTSITDKLTQVYNRLYIMEALSKEFSRCKRHKEQLSCILFDIDHFKNCNDTYGHQTGDAVLIGTAQAARSQIRKEDHFGRYGGEEFLLVLPNTTAGEALEVAEKIRKKIEGHVVEYGNNKLNITISLGIADNSDPQTKDEEELLHKADIALYHAKDSGRNRTILSKDVPV